MRRHLFAVLIVLAVLAVGAPQAGATTITLQDMNSTVLINPDGQGGVYQWTVDHTPMLFQQWFWYRIGNSAEQSIDTLGPVVISNQTNTGVNLTYTNLDLGLSIEVQYNLTGGSIGSGTSDVREAIRIQNLGTSSLDLHFFQYSDFDLGTNFFDDQVQIVDTHTVRQWDPMARLSETVDVPAANRYELDYFADTLDRLNDGVATNLASVNSGPSAALGPGDVTWAFQWDKTIAPGGTFIISKDKNLSTPEPGALLLTGGALIVLARLGSKRLRRRRG